MSLNAHTYVYAHAYKHAYARLHTCLVSWTYMLCAVGRGTSFGFGSVSERTVLSKSTLIVAWRLWAMGYGRWAVGNGLWAIAMGYGL